MKRTASDRPAEGCPANPGDLVVARLKSSGDWCVFMVADVDRDGAIASVFDVDDAPTAVYRLAEYPWLVCRAGRLKPEGFSDLRGLCSPELSDIKAAFRKWAA